MFNDEFRNHELIRVNSITDYLLRLNFLLENIQIRRIRVCRDTKYVPVTRILLLLLALRLVSHSGKIDKTLIQET